MFTKRIIIDIGNLSVPVVHAVLAYAKLAHDTGTADIKLVLPRMLIAEKAMTDHHYAIRHRRKERDLIRRKKLDEIYNPEDHLRLRQLLNDYKDYVVFPEPSPVEKAAEDQLKDYLIDLYRDSNYHPFDELTGLKATRIVEYHKEVDAALANPFTFGTAFCGWMMDKESEGRATKFAPGHDIADDAIVEWYKDFLTKEPDGDFVLISSDGGLRQRIEDANFAAKPRGVLECVATPRFAMRTREEISHMGPHDDSEQARINYAACLGLYDDLVKLPPAQGNSKHYTT